MGKECCLKRLYLQFRVQIKPLTLKKITLCLNSVGLTIRVYSCYGLTDTKLHTFSEVGNSSNKKPQLFARHAEYIFCWIPACAGMTEAL
jgi:hypothetical protein